MRSILMLLVCISSLWACHNEQQSQKEKQAAEHVHKEAAHQGLQLNNGAKWKADENTNRNVAEMQAVVHRYDEKTSKGLADYTQAASELQDGLDNLVSQCRMSGPDHDALHQWLEPLMGKVNELKKAGDAQRASELFAQIRDDMNSYHNFFE